MSISRVPDDERGALALIGEAQVQQAATLVRTGRVVDLGMALGPDTPVPGHRHGLVRFMNRDGGDYAAGAGRPGGFQFAEDTVLMPTHVGTHVDALAHVWHDDVLYNGHPQETIRSTTGAQRCGADKLGPIVARGVLLDVARDRALEAGEAIGAQALEREAAERDIVLQPGDVVLVRTGWLGRTGSSVTSYFDGEPGIDLSAARWLADAGVAVVGCDNFAVEPLPFSDGVGFPVHQHLICDRGIPLIEGLVLDELAGLADGPFLFIALPLALVGSTASPLNPVAVL
jgi:kynurenine formamidase